MKCWVCGKPAVWKVVAQKEKTETEAAVLVEFVACEKCVPFEIPKKEAPHV